MSSPTNLSQVTVQTDALTAIGDVEQGIIEHEDIWVSCYDFSKPSVHGKVAVTISDEDRTQCAFRGREGVKCKRIKKTVFHISCPALHIDERAVHFPNHIVTLPEVASKKTSSKLDRGINSLDVSADGQLWVVGLGNGSVLVGASPLTTKHTTPLEGNFHKGSVSAVRIVNPTTTATNPRVLSGSEDFTLALTELPNSPLPTSSGSNASLNVLSPPSIRLTSHTRSVTSVRSLPCGRKAISAGRDGTVRIWDLTPEYTSANRQIGIIRSTGDVAINSFTVCSTPQSTTLAALALQSGHFDLVDLETRNTLFSSSASGFDYTKNGPLDAIDISPLHNSAHKYLVVTGSQRGVLSFYICTVENANVTTTGLGSCVRNGAGISDIKFMPSRNNSENNYPRVLVATNDGLPYQLQISPTADSSRLEFEVAAEYAGGPDCSPVRSIVWHAGSNTVWIAGDDGVIWIY